MNVSRHHNTTREPQSLLVNVDDVQHFDEMMTVDDDGRQTVGSIHGVWNEYRNGILCTGIRFCGITAYLWTPIASEVMVMRVV